MSVLSCTWGNMAVVILDRFKAYCAYCIEMVWNTYTQLSILHYLLIQSHYTPSLPSSRSLKLPQRIQNVLLPLASHLLKPIYTHHKRASPACQRSQLIQIPHHLLQRHSSYNLSLAIAQAAAHIACAGGERVGGRVNKVGVDAGKGFVGVRGG